MASGGGGGNRSRSRLLPYTICELDNHLGPCVEVTRNMDIREPLHSFGSSASRSSTNEGSNYLNHCLPPFPFAAVELFAELADELPLGPCEPLIIDGDREQTLLTPALSLDLLGRPPLAAVTTWCPSHRATSGNSAAYPMTSCALSRCFGSCASRASFQIDHAQHDLRRRDGAPSVIDQRAATVAMDAAASPYAAPRSAMIRLPLGASARRSYACLPGSR